MNSGVGFIFLPVCRVLTDNPQNRKTLCTEHTGFIIEFNTWLPCTTGIILYKTVLHTIPTQPAREQLGSSWAHRALPTTLQPGASVWRDWAETLPSTPAARRLYKCPSHASLLPSTAAHGAEISAHHRLPRSAPAGRAGSRRVALGRPHKRWKAAVRRADDGRLQWSWRKSRRRMRRWQPVAEDDRGESATSLRALGAHCRHAPLLVQHRTTSSRVGLRSGSVNWGTTETS
eukprot:COSAG02_NODE_2651_length_8325_cov_5.663506_6_plen_231_part_00